MATATTDRRFINLNDAEERSGMSKSTLRRLIKRGVIKGYMPVGRLLIDVDELDAAVRASAVEPNEESVPRKAK